MPHTDIARLRGIKTLPQLAAYLRDELDWPIESDDADAITFEYEAAELGLDEKTAVRIKEIKQLRPLTGNQPWGIFFINFEKKRLPVVVMRRILRALVLKKRDAANKADRQAWQPNDLLFISAYGEESDRAITFAHFVEESAAGGAAELRVLGWDDDDTPLKYDYVAHTLHEKLRWRGDFERDKEAWRTHWREAFVLRHREVISTSRELALALAGSAKKIRGRVRSILRYEDSAGEMRKLQRAFQQALIHDLGDDDFADMLAQTVTYGLFSVSVRRTFPGEGTAVTREDAQHLIFTSPFLKEMMNTFLGVKSRKGKIDFDELGIADVTDLLQSPDTHMEAVLRDFGNKTRGEDPVIHFYELFLTEYDKQKKIQRGVFYTPQPVVSYIVRSVHELLQTEFGLADGLADTTTWREMLKKHPGLKLPPLTDEPGEKRTISPDEPFVQILDPATGTATFLVEVIDVIHRTLAAKWKQERLTDAQQRAGWNDYVPQHLLPRLHAFELMMAPYAIAHMKIGLKLAETGYRFGTDERARIYLTNALEPKVKQLPQIGFDALAHEAAAVNEIKWYKRFTVVIGNPPYSGISSNRNDWIEGLLKGEVFRGGSNYYEVDGESIAEKKIWLQDDYVKFIRLSHFLLEQTSVGIHGMITNHSFVDSPTCRGMRFQMLRFFSVLNIIDLHGSTKRAEEPPNGIVDENVFDILPGVAISVCARSSSGANGSVQSFDLWGTRNFKYDWLRRHNNREVAWIDLKPSQPYHLFVKRQLDFDKEYLKFFSLKEIFPFYGTGIQTSRDEFATDADRAALEDRLRKFFDLRHSDNHVIETFALADTRGWKIKQVRRSANLQNIFDTIIQCAFRPFDKRWIPLTKDIVDWPRLEVMSCVSKNRLGLLCSRQQSTPGFRHALAVDMPADMFCISNKSREGQTLFPLFVQDGNDLFRSGKGTQSRPNLGAAFTKEFTKLLSVAEISVQHANDVFRYVYAVLHSQAYRNRYVDLLKMDYPRLPLTGNLDLFRALAQLGGELTALHLLESPKLDKPITEFIGGRNPEVEKTSWSKNTVWIDKDQTIGFKGVREEVWNFHIGGYQVCQKWLKDRKGRTLAKDDLAYYHKIVMALSETIRLMGEIDEEIENAGGWPLK